MAVKRYYTREGFVYVPELKTNGRNWKEYREQVLEVARIQNVIGHLAGVEQKPKVAGKELNEWLQQNSSAQFILMWNIPDSLFSHIQHFEMAHEMFDYLATTFRDYIPIPLPTTKPVEASSGDVAADEPPSTNDLQEQKDGSAFEAHASGDDVQDEPRESCAKPNESSMELPRMERLEDELTEARSNDKAEAAVGAAQWVPSRSTEVEDHEPEVPSESRTAQSKLQEQQSSRAGGPLESEHPQVLNGTVKVPYEVEDVDRAVELASEAAGRARRVDTSDEMASEDLPSKLCDGSTMNDLPGTRRLPLEGEQAVCTSGSVEDTPTAPARCKGSPHEQSRLVDVNHGNHRCGTSMDTIADKAETPSMPNNTETIPTELEVSDESRRVSDKIVAEGSLGVEATDIAASKEIVTRTLYLSRDGGDTKSCYQILKPANAGAASCIEAQPAGAHSQPEYSPMWNVPETTNALLEGEQNGYASNNIANGQGHNNGPQLTIHDPGGYLGQLTVCTASRQNAKTRENAANKGNMNSRVLPTSRSQHAERERLQMKCAPALRTPPTECTKRRQRIFRVRHQCGRLKTTTVDVSEAKMPPRKRIGVIRSDIPDARRLPLEGEQAGCASGGDMNTAADGHTDKPSGHADGPRGLTATPSVSNEGEAIVAVLQICNVDVGTYGGTQWHINEMESLGIHTNAPRNETDTASIAYGTKTASDARQNVRTCQTELDSPRKPESESPDHTMPWRRVGIGDANISVPRNMPLETTSTPNHDITFGRPASTDRESATKSVEGKMAGGDSKRSNGEDGTMSSGSVDSARVKAALLATESQHAFQSQSLRGDIPVSSKPPATHRKHCCALIRPKRRHGRIKPEARNVRTMRKVENACQEHGNAMRSTSHNREGIGTCLEPTYKCWEQGQCRRPARNRCNVNMDVSRRTRGPGGREKVQQALGHVKTKGTRCQTGDATSNASCDSKRVETRLLAGDEDGQHRQQRRKPSDVPGPPASHRKRSDEVSGPKRRLRTFKFESRYVSRARKLENAHQGGSNAMRLISHHREGIGTCPDLTHQVETLPAISRSRAITNGTPETVQQPASIAINEVMTR